MIDTVYEEYSTLTEYVDTSADNITAIIDSLFQELQTSKISTLEELERVANQISNGNEAKGQECLRTAERTVERRIHEECE